MLKRRTRILGFVLVATSALFGCGGGGSSPTSPSGPPTTTAPAATSLSGTVAVNGGSRVAGAVVTILDGPNKGRETTTSSSGDYRLEGLTAGNANVKASATGYPDGTAGIYISGATTLNILLPFYKEGQGDTVFDMPTNVRRVKITGQWTGSGTSNFIVYIGGYLVVNEIMRSYPNGHFEGTYATNGGAVQIKSSGQIAWTFLQVG